MADDPKRTRRFHPIGKHHHVVAYDDHRDAIVESRNEEVVQFVAPQAATKAQIDQYDEEFEGWAKKRWGSAA